MKEQTMKQIEKGGREGERGRERESASGATILISFTTAPEFILNLNSFQQVRSQYISLLKSAYSIYVSSSIE